MGRNQGAQWWWCCYHYCDWLDISVQPCSSKSEMKGWRMFHLLSNRRPSLTGRCVFSVCVCVCFFVQELQGPLQINDSKFSSGHRNGVKVKGSPRRRLTAPPTCVVTAATNNKLPFSFVLFFREPFHVRPTPVLPPWPGAMGFTFSFTGSQWPGKAKAQVQLFIL